MGGREEKALDAVSDPLSVRRMIDNVCTKDDIERSIQRLTVDLRCFPVQLANDDWRYLGALRYTCGR